MITSICFFIYLAGGMIYANYVFQRLEWAMELQSNDLELRSHQKGLREDIDSLSELLTNWKLVLYVVLLLFWLPLLCKRGRPLD